MLRTFETDDAVYYLGLGKHTTSSESIFKKVDFSSLDFFVFEDCILHLDGEAVRTRLIEADIQYNKLYLRINEENPNMRLYGVDVNSPPYNIGSLLQAALSAGSVAYLGKKTFDLLVRQKKPFKELCWTFM